MLSLYFVETKRSWLNLTRYPMEAVAVVVMLVIMFYGLFLGADYMAGPSANFSERLDGIVIGYAAWMLTVGVFNGIGGDIQQEIQVGTLEQIFIAKRSFLTVTLVRALANLAINVVLTTVMLLAIMALTGTWLTFTTKIILPLTIVIITAIGLGLVLGGLTILLKRTRGLMGMAQFGLIFLMMTPFETFKGFMGLLGEILPLAKGMGLVRASLIPETTLATSDLLIASANSLVYLLLGCIVLVRFTRSARKNGTLVHY